MMICERNHLCHFLKATREKSGVSDDLIKSYDILMKHKKTNNEEEAIQCVSV